MSLFALALTICLTPTVQADGSYKDSCDSYYVQEDDSFTTKRRCINHGLRPEATKILIITDASGTIADYLSAYGINTPVDTIDHIELSCEPVGQET